MKDQGARTGRRTLASTCCWLLLLAGLSCKYNVTLPWVPSDASERAPDASFDQSTSSSPDRPLPSADLPLPSPDLPLPSPDIPVPGADAHVCPGSSYKAWKATRAFAQIIFAIDRSSWMQKDFDSTSKMLAASSAVSALVDRHPGISFSTIWFPWTGCGGAACCASPVLTSLGKTAPPDASGGCGPFDAGCLPPSNDSPSHQALRKANSYINTSPLGRWNSTIVLITDQNPSCASEQFSEGNACTEASDEAGKLGSESSIRTFVVVPNTDGRTPDCLPWIASRNAHNFGDAEQLMTVKSSREMRDKLDLIANEIDEKLCRFYLQEMVDPGQIESIEIAGTRVDRDETGKTGWRLAYGAILLSPDVCKSIAQTENPDVKAITCNSGNGPGGPFGY